MATRMKFIAVPKTPKSAFNKNRQISELLRAQVNQAHAQLLDWIKHNVWQDPSEIRTEQEAADFVRMVSRVLHPEGASGGATRTLPSGRGPKSGVSLAAPAPQRRHRTGRHK